MNAITDKAMLKDWLTIFEQCTPSEREEITLAMIRRVESRRRETLDVYKRSPDLLAGLSVSELRDVARQASEEAYTGLLTAFPEAGELLNSFECLSAFGVGAEETISHNELADVIASLKTVWASVSAETKPTARQGEFPFDTLAESEQAHNDKP